MTKLIITHTHERRGHGTGVEHLLTELRSKYNVSRMSAKICNQTTRSDDGTAPVSQSTNAIKSVRQNWSGLWWTVSYKTGKRKTESQEISVFLRA